MLIHALVGEKRVAEIILHRRFAAGIQQRRRVTDHPNFLRKPEIAHRLRQVVGQHARLQFHQGCGKLYFHGRTGIAAERRRPEIGEDVRRIRPHRK